MLSWGLGGGGVKGKLQPEIPWELKGREFCARQIYQTSFKSMKYLILYLSQQEQP